MKQTRYKTMSINVSEKSDIACLNEELDEGWEWVEGITPSSPAVAVTPMGCSKSFGARYVLAVLKKDEDYKTY